MYFLWSRSGPGEVDGVLLVYNAVVTTQVWNAALRLVWHTSANPVKFNLVHNEEHGTGKGGSISVLQNALLCQNALLSLSRVRARATSVFVFNFTFCQLSKVLTRIWMLLVFGSRSDFEFHDTFWFTRISNQPRNCIPFFLLTTSCVQAPLHNSLATVLALVHTHPSS